MPVRSRKIKVVIVDDSTFIRRAIARMLRIDPAFEVAGEAADGLAAIDLIKEVHPDLVTLDVNMPGMSGLTVLKRIMTEHPLPVLMVSSLTREGGEITLEALACGAADFIDKSACHTTMDIINIASVLLEKLKALAGLDVARLQTSSASRPAPQPAPAASGTQAAEGEPTHLVAIASSTGGPVALERVLGCVPGNFSGAILVVQHMPLGFTASLAERFDKLFPFTVREAEEGMEVCSGHVYIGRAGSHLLLERRGRGHRLHLDPQNRDGSHVPSADVMMTSVARNSNLPLMGVVLTGMGADGAKGIIAMKGAGAHVVAQSEPSCVVYGMPKAAHATGCVDLMLNLDAIGAGIADFMKPPAHRNTTGGSAEGGVPLIKIPRVMSA